MKLLLISVVLLQAWCNALPNPNGVATYSFQDSNGKRYGGTYNIPDDISPFREPVIPPVIPPMIAPFRAAYIPPFFNQFGNILEHENLGRVKRRLPFGRARLLRNRFPFGGFPFGGFGPFNMDRLAHNSAFSSAVAGPGYAHQSAIISPANPNNPNVVVNRYEEPVGPGNFYSVSSSSYSSSNDNNGKLSGFRGSETIVNNNGKVTKYRVTS